MIHRRFLSIGQRIDIFYFRYMLCQEYRCPDNFYNYSKLNFVLNILYKMEYRLFGVYPIDTITIYRFYLDHEDQIFYYQLYLILKISVSSRV